MQWQNKTILKYDMRYKNVYLSEVLFDDDENDDEEDVDLNS